MIVFSAVEIQNAQISSKTGGEQEDRWQPWTPRCVFGRQQSLPWLRVYILPIPSPFSSVYSQYQINASETHSTIGLYSGWDYTEFMALAHVPIRPPNDYYPLGDVLANGQALDGSHINILAIVKNVSGSKMVKLYLSHLAGSTLSLRNGLISLPHILLPHTCSDSVCTMSLRSSLVILAQHSPLQGD